MQFELTLPHLTVWPILLLVLLITCSLLIPLIIIRVYNAAIALSKIASYPGTGVQHWFLGSYPDRHHLTGKTVQAIHNSIRQPAIVVADYAAATQVFLNSPWPKPAVNELVDRAETQYARKVGEKVTGTR